MANEEDEIKEFVNEYIKVLNTGKTKFVEENIDYEAMYAKDGEIYGKYGLSKKMSLKEYEESFKTQTLFFMKQGWDKKFEVESYEMKGDEAHVKIKAEWAKRQDQPLIIKKAKKKWKLIWIPMWGF